MVGLISFSSPKYELRSHVFANYRVCYNSQSSGIVVALSGGYVLLTRNMTGLYFLRIAGFLLCQY